MTKAGTEADLAELRHRFHLFADHDCGEMPLYRAICNDIAESDDVLALLAEAPAGQRRPVLLLAAIHFTLAAHTDAPLAEFYPSLGGSRRADSPAHQAMTTALEAFIDEHAAKLAELCRTRTTQTNEVNRSCAWFVAAPVAAATHPNLGVSLIEVGSSAGLNLFFDRYTYRFTRARNGGHPELERRGDPAAPTLTCELTGETIPDQRMPEVVSRTGLDMNPVSPTDHGAIAWLRSCLWPEQQPRLERFDAAAAFVTAQPEPRVFTGDLVDRIDDALDDLPASSHAIVYSSWVLSYVERSRRAEFVSRLTQRSLDRPVSLLSVESNGCIEGLETNRIQPSDRSTSIVGLTSFENGRATHTVLGTCHPHLRWLSWH